MSLEIWTLYVAAVAALMSTPGPSQLLMLSNSMAHGFRRSLITAAGDLTANVLQMLFAGLGLAAVIMAFENALFYIKWGGVLYLVWMGVRMILSADKDAGGGGTAPKAQLRNLFMQGFVTSASNPKAVIFFAALFPQFISPAMPFWPQFLILSATYVVMDAAMLSLYGSGAGWIAARLKGPARARLKKLGGAFMLGAAVMLGLKPVGR